MSHHDSGGNSSLDAVGHTIVRGAEVGAAMYALDHAAKGTPIGAEGDLAAQATRTVGNFVIVAFLWHWLIAPYLVVTGIVFAIPTVAIGLAIAQHVWGQVITGAVFVVSLVLWFRYAVYTWLWRRFIRPVDATLSGRQRDDPATLPTTRFRDDPKRHLIEYNELQGEVRSGYLLSQAAAAGTGTPVDLRCRQQPIPGLEPGSDGPTTGDDDAR